MISHRHNTIFIHINKCGGSSIDHALSGKFGGHSSTIYYKKKFPYHFNEYFKFSIIRNPWDRMVSLYHFHKKQQWRKWTTTAPDSFEDFIKNYLNPGSTTPKSGIPISTCCYDWLYDKKGARLVDFIGRFENLEQDFHEACRRAKIKRRSLPHINQSDRKHYSIYYNNKTQDIVNKVFRKDVEFFKFKFNNKKCI